jgi:hypothetical protein
MDLYTYFTADQTRCLLISGIKGTRPMLRHLKESFPNDFQQLILAIADCMPQLVAEDRVYKSGPRRGQRKLVFRDIAQDISGIMAQELTGCATREEFVKAYAYCGVYSGAGLTMVETVLAPPVSSEQYAKCWIRSFLDIKKQGFPNLKAHYLAMTQVPMDRAQKAVDTWLACNPHTIEEVMTWTGDKYNKWHFAQQELAVA